ncbi:MAG: hypothetical protein MRY81_24265 [Donghicola eburneus]|nr:hypothetical protein [Donghicola eburneus]MCI5042767.1 hypothetical protein [Donghicola eburneus]
MSDDIVYFWLDSQGYAGTAFDNLPSGVFYQSFTSDGTLVTDAQLLPDTDDVYNPFVFFDDGAVYLLHTTDVTDGDDYMSFTKFDASDLTILASTTFRTDEFDSFLTSTGIDVDKVNSGSMRSHLMGLRRLYRPPPHRLVSVNDPSFAVSFGMRGDDSHQGCLTNRIQLRKAVRWKPSSHAPCGHEVPNSFG